MNTEIIAHPTLQHVGIMTPNLDAMLEWYRKVLGMTVNKRVCADRPRAVCCRRIHKQRRDQSSHLVLRGLTSRSISKGPAMLGFSTSPSPMERLMIS